MFCLVQRRMDPKGHKISLKVDPFLTSDLPSINTAKRSVRDVSPQNACFSAGLGCFGSFINTFVLKWKRFCVLVRVAFASFLISLDPVTMQQKPARFPIFRCEKKKTAGPSNIEEYEGVPIARHF